MKTLWLYVFTLNFVAAAQALLAQGDRALQGQIEQVANTEDIFSDKLDEGYSFKSTTDYPGG